MQNGGELSVSSETPAAFPKDIIRASNSLQTLHTLLLQCVPALVCTHTSVVWLSSQNCGQIALSCSYSGMMFFFHHSALVFILLFHSPFTLPPLYPPPPTPPTPPTQTHTNPPPFLSLPVLTFPDPCLSHISFYILMLSPNFQFHHPLCASIFLLWKTLQCVSTWTEYTKSYWLSFFSSSEIRAPLSTQCECL